MFLLRLISAALFLCLLVMRVNGFKPKKKFHIQGRAILAQAKFNKLEGRSQLREAKLEELSLEIRDNLLIPSSLRLLS